MDAHTTDHARLDAAWDAWVAAGRPRVGINYGRHDARKRAVRRALGLRFQAHFQVIHHTTFAIDTPFDDIKAQHDALHNLPTNDCTGRR